MEKIIILTKLEIQLNELIETLYENNYFDFNESAYEYVDKIVTFMNNLPKQHFKPIFNVKFGNYYSYYKHNYKTTWIIFFDKEDENYLVKFITNNHSSDYPKIIAAIK